MPDSSFQSWEPELLRACKQCSACRGFFDRVLVPEAAPSTQDVARTSAHGKAGLVVTTLRQTAGRGRLGRAWVDGEEKGLAMTFVVDPRKFPVGFLSLASGVAAAWTVGAIADPTGTDAIGLKWPNDVVERGGLRRKIAGVLIEQSDGLAYLGIGVNVHQDRSEFPFDLQDRAASLAMLGASVDRLEVATRLITRLNIALGLLPAQLVKHWRALDVLSGTRRTFDNSGQRITGKVIDIDPLEAITVELPSGDQVRLPVMTTTLLKDPSP